MTRLQRVAVLALVLTSIAPVIARAADNDSGFIPLFDGKTLNGWEQHGGKAHYSVEDGCIVGATVPNTPNSFLCTKKHFSNFVLEYDFKDHTLNSGVQIRSHCFDHPTTYEWKGKEHKINADRVHGYQIEIDADKPNRMWVGCVYEEGRRGWLYPGIDGGDAKKITEQGKKLYKKDDWNHVRVEVVGDHIQTWLNGEKRADVHDKTESEGFVALQVHTVGGRKDPLKVMFRNIRIKPLDSGASANESADAGDESGFTDLFDGKDLKGWNNPYTWGKATVEDGTIALQANKKFFLVTDKKYSNFILEAQIMLPTTGHSNSGIMFRCHAEKNKVYGYQAECDPSDRAWTGGLYDEGRRGWLHPHANERGKTHLVQAPLGKWIHYRIECQGDHIQIFIDGKKTTDYHDDKDASGYIGLQHHGEHGQVYHFRDIRIKPLGQ